MKSNTSNNILRSIIDKEKLSETNFLDWHRNLRIVLKHEKKLYVHDELVHEEAPPSGASRANRDAYSKHANDVVDVLCIMLATMTSELQKQHENMDGERFKTLYQ